MWNNTGLVVISTHLAMINLKLIPISELKHHLYIPFKIMVSKFTQKQCNIECACVL